MLQPLRKWLNGRRDYDTGVTIYSQCNPDPKLLALFLSGTNEFRVKRLLQEMLRIYQQLKTDTGAPVGTKTTQGANKMAQNANKVATGSNIIPKTSEKYSHNQVKNIPPAKAVNEELYQACKLEADNEYKKLMNDRAVLFHKARPDGYLDINKPDLIADRAGLAIQVTIANKKVADLYDKAAFVKEHGRLPTTTGDEPAENEYDHIPDSLVKQQLDNARKAYNKLKKKPTNPERVALLQKHEANIKKLKEKWDSLQPVK